MFKTIISSILLSVICLAETEARTPVQATCYVDPDGNDSADASELSSLKSLSVAITLSLRVQSTYIRYVLD